MRFVTMSDVRGEGGGVRDDRGVAKTKTLPSTPDTATTKRRAATKEVVVYTDGACTNNGSKKAEGGIGVFFGDGDGRNVSRRILPSAEVPAITNQSMELMACKTAVLRWLQSAHDASEDAAVLCVRTDSEYVVKSMMLWAKRWEKDGWKGRNGRPVSNLGLMRDLYATRKRHGVRFEHVSAHRAAPPCGSDAYPSWYGNMRADELARGSVVRGAA